MNEENKLNLGCVSNQRELLIKFLEWEYNGTSKVTASDKVGIDTFLEELNL
tara:strand:- start:157 stop:309 length:153 start_codon:yes stop_codon:yes gene_type:complete